MAAICVDEETREWTQYLSCMLCCFDKAGLDVKASPVAPG